MSKTRTIAAINSAVARLRTATSPQHAIDILSSEAPHEPPVQATEICEALTAAGWNAHQVGALYWLAFAPDGSGPLIIVEPPATEPEATDAAATS